MAKKKPDELSQKMYNALSEALLGKKPSGQASSVLGKPNTQELAVGLTLQPLVGPAKKQPTLSKGQYTKEFAEELRKQAKALLELVAQDGTMGTATGVITKVIIGGHSGNDLSDKHKAFKAALELEGDSPIIVRNNFKGKMQQRAAEVRQMSAGMELSLIQDKKPLELSDLEAIAKDSELDIIDLEQIVKNPKQLQLGVKYDTAFQDSVSALVKQRNKALLDQIDKAKTREVQAILKANPRFAKEIVVHDYSIDMNDDGDLRKYITPEKRGIIGRFQQEMGLTVAEEVEDLYLFPPPPPPSVTDASVLAASSTTSSSFSASSRYSSPLSSTFASSTSSTSQPAEQNPTAAPAASGSLPAAAQTPPAAPASTAAPAASDPLHAAGQTSPPAASAASTSQPAEQTALPAASAPTAAARAEQVDTPAASAASTSQPAPQADPAVAQTATPEPVVSDPVADTTQPAVQTPPKDPATAEASNVAPAESSSQFTADSSTTPDPQTSFTYGASSTAPSSFSASSSYSSSSSSAFASSTSSDPSLSSSSTASSFSGAGSSSNSPGSSAFASSTSSNPQSAEQPPTAAPAASGPLPAAEQTAPAPTATQASTAAPQAEQADTPAPDASTPQPAEQTDSASTSQPAPQAAPDAGTPQRSLLDRLRDVVRDAASRVRGIFSPAQETPNPPAAPQPENAEAADQLAKDQEAAISAQNVQDPKEEVENLAKKDPLKPEQVKQEQPLVRGSSPAAAAGRVHTSAPVDLGKLAQGLEDQEAQFLSDARGSDSPPKKSPTQTIAHLGSFPKEYGVRTGKKVGGVHKGDPAGGVFKNDSTKAIHLIKRDTAKPENDIAEFMGSRLFAVLAPGQGAEISLVKRRGLGIGPKEQPFLASRFFEGYDGDFHKQAGHKKRNDVREVIYSGDITAALGKKDAGKRYVYSQYESTTVASLAIGDFSIHSGNIGVVAKQGEPKKLVRIDFGAAFRELTTDINPFRRIEGRAKNNKNYFKRDHPRERIYSPEFARELRAQASKLKEQSTTEAIDAAWKEIIDNFSEKDIRGFAKRIGVQRSDASIDKIKGHFVSFMQQRADSMVKMADEIDARIAIEAYAKKAKAGKHREVLDYIERTPHVMDYAMGKDKDQMERPAKATTEKFLKDSRVALNELLYEAMHKKQDGELESLVAEHPKCFEYIIKHPDDFAKVNPKFKQKIDEILAALPRETPAPSVELAEDMIAVGSPASASQQQKEQVREQQADQVGLVIEAAPAPAASPAPSAPALASDSPPPPPPLPSSPPPPIPATSSQPQPTTAAQQDDDPILKAIREGNKKVGDIIQTKLDEFQKQLQPLQVTPEEILKSAPIRKAAFGLLSKEELQQIHQAEKALHQAFEKACGDSLKPIKWEAAPQPQDGSPAVKSQSIKDDSGVELCVLKETTISKPTMFPNGHSVASCRTIDFPKEIAKDKGPMHLSFALKDKDGQNMPKADAVYFTAHYDKAGKICEISHPVPIKFMGKEDGAVGYIERNGQIYTLPVTQGKYKEIIQEIGKNTGVKPKNLSVTEPEVRQQPAKAVMNPSRTSFTIT